MSFWTGTHWEPEAPAPVPARPSKRRHAFEAITEGALITALIFGLIAGTAFAGKGGNGKGGGHAATAGSPTLVASPDVLHAGDSFDVSGCGFDESLGSVLVGFTGGSWGSKLTDGCFTITGIPALSGDTLAPGSYDVTAFQYINGRWRAVAATSVKVVAD